MDTSSWIFCPRRGQDINVAVSQEMSLESEVAGMGKGEQGRLGSVKNIKVIN